MQKQWWFSYKAFAVSARRSMWPHEGAGMSELHCFIKKPKPVGFENVIVFLIFPWDLSIAVIEGNFGKAILLHIHWVGL